MYRNGNTGVQESPAFLYIHNIPDSLHEELVECEYLLVYSHVNSSEDPVSDAVLAQY